MPNQIDNYGLQVNTHAETLAALTAALQAIYGTDINLDSSSPDGQNIQIFAQSVTDILELLNEINNSFDVESANGVILDQRVALNGISRKQGAFTITPISITVDRALTLPGLDADVADINGTGFTVADDAGNEWILATTHAFGAAGTASLSFRAKNIGLVETTLNTITNQVTVTTGVTAVNNPAAATTIGSDEESDVELKIRRINSYKLQAQNNADAVEAAILTVPAVTSALVVEDDGAHTIWCIVEGGAAAVIAETIYAKASSGCGLVGDDESEVVTRINGLTKTIVFDRPIVDEIYIKFTLTPKTSGLVFDETGIAADLAAALTYGLNQRATIGDVVSAMAVIEPEAFLSVMGISANNTDWYDILTPSTAQHKFLVTAAKVAITQ